MRHATLKVVVSFKTLCSSLYVRKVKKQLNKLKKKSPRSSSEGELLLVWSQGDSSYASVRNVCVKVSENDRDFYFKISRLEKKKL